MPRRLKRVATRQTVPLPTKGSSTVQGTVGASQKQVGFQPRVVISPGSPARSLRAYMRSSLCGRRG